MMRDFTLAAYQRYLHILRESGAEFLTFSEFLENTKVAPSVVLIRHDVDRKPRNALRMARLEKSMGIKATYYFRDRKRIFIPEIVREIEQMGHEIGYHYECLSDADGNFEQAYLLFKAALAKYRSIANIKTISMHGSPLKPFDNRDLWNSNSGDALLKDLEILGEIYLAIDYTNIAYVNDTGRNWLSTKSNRRDKVSSNINADFASQRDLEAYFKSPDKIVVFQVHPERWSNTIAEWFVQLCLDYATNLAKVFFKLLRR